MSASAFWVELLARSTVLAAVLLAIALGLGGLLFRRRPGVRHAALLLSLGAAVASPAWLLLAAEAAPAASVDTGDEPFSFVGLVAGKLADPAARLGPPAAIDGPSPISRGGWPDGIAAFVLLVWAVGVTVALARLGRGLWLAAGIRGRARPLGDELWLSEDVPHAAVVGLWRPRVLVHPTLLERPRAALDQVLDHERAHARRGDPLWGAVERLLAALAWHHPLVPLVRRELATAREEACDLVVIDRHSPADYARTLLALATAPARTMRAHLAGVLQSGPALEPRIRRLLAGSAGRPTRPHRLAGVAFGLVLLGSTLPLTAVLAMPRPVQGSAPSAAAPSLPWGERPLDADERALVERAGAGVEAAFVLRELGGGGTSRQLVLGPELATERVTPDSTFKMIIALAALEEGVASDEQFRLPFTGVPEPIPGANQDHTLASAMKTSATWYFTELLRRVPPARVRRLVVGDRYGNAAFQADDARFWLRGALAISPREQVDFFGRLHQGQLSVGARSRETLTRVTLLEQHAGVRLYGKTGTATGPTVPGGAQAWLVGHVEGGPRKYVYALFLRPGSRRLGEAGDASEGLRNARRDILRGLLQRFSVLPAGGSR